MTTYFWKPNVSIPVKPQIAGERLETIRVRNNGRLTAEDVVEDARPEDSPLHPAFEWNDDVAAEKWRAEQARYLIRSLVVRVDRAEGEPTPIRAFVSVERDEDRSFTSLAHAMSDEELRQQVLNRAWAELLAWRRRYQEYQELAAIFSAIEQAMPQDSAA